MAGARSDEEREFWREFIQLYRSLPELWKVGSDEYRNRRKKDAAYVKLVEKMKEIIPAADRNIVRTKINVLRSSYRREIKKVKDSLEFGEGKEDVYFPNLWYFYDIDFLRGQENVDDPEIEDGSILRSSDPQSLKKRKSFQNKIIQTNTEEESKKMKFINRSGLPASESDILSWGWAIEYEKLSADQQLFAKKFIDDILFEGRMGNLNRHSVTISQPSESINHCQQSSSNPPPRPSIFCKASTIPRTFQSSYSNDREVYNLTQ